MMLTIDIDTSKVGRGNVFGSKGLFLAALAAMSVLTITSCRFDELETSTIIFHRSTVVSRLIPAPVHHALNHRHGTRVTVNDLFGNMPVRVKQRALSLQRSGDVDKEWNELKRMLTALVLAVARPLKLRLSTADKSRTMTLRDEASPEKGVADVERTRSILCQAGLISREVRDWITLSANTLDLSIRACLSLVPCATKQVQFISIGILPVFNSPDNSNPIYREINKLFAASKFGLDESSGSKEQNPIAKGSTKGVDRWPMFHIRIDISTSWEMFDQYEMILESNKALQHILDVLGAMINQFLDQHHFRPRGLKRPRVFEAKTTQQANVTHTANTNEAERIVRQKVFVTKGAEEGLDNRIKFPAFRRSSLDAGFRNWSRIKSGSPKDLEELVSCARKPEYTSRSAHFASAQSQQMGNEHRGPTSGDELVHWTDPISRRTFLVNSRTGQCVAPKDVGTGNPEELTIRNRPCSAGIVAGCVTRDTIVRPRSAPAGTGSQWLESVMGKWQNPVFARPEEPIASVSSLATEPGSQPMSHFCVGDDGAGITGSGEKLSKKGLREARVIAQVDQKFILLRVPCSAGKSDMLVLVDQHAADERCRVEQLYADMFVVKPNDGSQLVSINTFNLLEPIDFTIQQSEASLFAQYCQFFASWGIHYKILDRLGDNPKVSITALPILITERCRMEPKLIIDLLREEIYSQNDTDSKPIRPDCVSSTSTPLWIDWITSCPKGVVELLKSRACRTAIMFHDPLSIEECQSLVTRLSRCAFPFQCAHGRPSIFPASNLDILRLGQLASVPDSDERGFVEAFRAWE